MNWKPAILLPYIIAHFFIDFACAFLVIGLLVEAPNGYLSLLFYNFCAFALQMPIGLLADRFKRNALCAAMGCGLVALAFPLGEITMLSAILAGVGNGMFHIGGGIEVLNVGKEKPTLLGIFVSPGALGIYLGTLLGKKGSRSEGMVVSALILMLILILVFQYLDKKNFRSANAVLTLQSIGSAKTITAIGCLLLVVILRSYIGMISSFAWKSDVMWASLLIVAVVLGKIFGGILAIPLGIKRTCILSLGLAAGLFPFSDIPILGVAAVFFFNMTMPLTLWAMAKLLAGSKGFAFGILTFGLFLGFIPSYLELPPLFSTTMGFMVASVASLLLLLYGIKRAVV